MEEEEKNKETEPNDSSTNKQNVIDNDMSHSNYIANNSEVFRHMNKEIAAKNEENLQGTQTQTMEIKTEPNNQSQINATLATKNNPLMQSTFNFTNSRHYYFKINRCLTARIKKIILIIFLTISIFFVFISLFDIINSIRKTSFFKENKFLMNYLIVFIFQIAYALSLLLFQGLSIIMEPKKNILFNTISIILISIIIILRTVLVIKNDDKNITMLLNLLCSICLTFINFGIFIMTLKSLKMKKNVQQNIDEILNFTDLLQATNNSKITEKKDNQLMFNNSSSENKQEIQNQNNKEGISQLVEESNINNNNIANPNEAHK
jgi:hypothetical protein